MKEADEIHQMNTADIAQPTKSDELGSPRSDGRGAEPRSGNPPLNPYSCLSCRKKKKKCDRVYPCINCRKAGVDCLFVPRRPSTRPKTTQGMLERLQHLEGVIDHLRDNYSHATPEDFSEREKALQKTNLAEIKATSPSVSAHSGRIHDDEVIELGTEFGRLATGEGRSRYISSSFWASLDEEVEDLKSLLMDLPDDTKAWNTPPTLPGIGDASSQNFIFGIVSHNDSLLHWHPSLEQSILYWRLFKENCDPLIKILHIPTVEPIITQATRQLSCISKGLEALIFSIYFSVVVSLSEEECWEAFGAHKSNLVHTYKFATEQALARAKFLETDELIVLQAFVIFLMSLRNHCSIRLMWSLTALVVRLAQNAGIHRDGTHFNLSPFTTEMRRRLWWSICVLDSRACEDSGHDATLPPDGADTCIPLNINDLDLSVHMKEIPEARTGLTEMTFSLVRFEATALFRRLQYSSTSSSGKFGRVEAASDLTKKMKQISETQQRLQELYLQYCNLSDPFSWFVYTISQIVFTKMRLVAHHPSLRNAGYAGLPNDTKDRLFTSSITILEYWLALNTEKKTRKWRWLCETYIQWYALTFLLSALCVRSESEEVDRAWNAVDATLQLGVKLSFISNQKTGTNPGGLLNMDETCCDAYKPLHRLIKKARAARSQASLSRRHAIQTTCLEVANMSASDGSGDSTGGVGDRDLRAGHFFETSPLGGIYTSTISASHELPHVYQEWIYDLEFHNQESDGVSIGMNWEIDSAADGTRVLGY